MLETLWILLLSCFICVAATSAAADKAQHDIAWLSRHTATKTHYTPGQVDTIADDYMVEQLQLVVRHGSRFPSDGDTSDIAALLKKLARGKNQTLAWVHNFDNVYTPSRSGLLDLNGQREEYLHGQRVADQFSDLLTHVVDSQGALTGLSSYCSWSQRTSQSAVAFLTGLFSRKVTDQVPFMGYVLTQQQNNDSLIAMDDDCPAWDAQAKSNETDAFKERALAPIAARLSRDLGVALEADDVATIYTGCAFEISHRRDASTFCTLLTRKEVEAAEYHEDLNYYYKYAYGRALNSKVACALAQDLVQAMDDVVNGKDGAYRMTLKFGHTQTIVFLETFLGLFHDAKPLVANASEAAIQKRMFRTSNIASFASNVGLQLLSKDKEHYVRVVVSEAPVILPGCNAEVCSYALFRKVLASRLQCSFQDVCQKS
ncbi:histidine phosphatase superfamily [Syncephalastrum racemosum]|uniref:Multiple inositol polyphosphate phosphatase 1 n=1 Tax=Syncephalastrum racemosum TaxID=13706 RepID=A0A1X2H048_SYNRA|nr:histidine phosphatase superfamily [Syncephalastrum racemosum]